MGRCSLLPCKAAAALPDDAPALGVLAVARGFPGCTDKSSQTTSNRRTGFGVIWVCISSSSSSSQVKSYAPTSEQEKLATSRKCRWQVAQASAVSALHLPRLPEPPTHNLTYTRNVRASTSPRKIGFCAIWGCISSSSSSVTRAVAHVLAGGRARC